MVLPEAHHHSLKIAVLCVFTHVSGKWKSQLWSYVVCSIGNSLVLILVCFGGFSRVG